MSGNLVPMQHGPPEPSGRYEVVDTIAQGDFATVYRARDRELGREVAIKAIHPQYLTDPRQLERYWQEAQLLATLQHPNILTIYDIVRPRGWLILELMRGNLAQAIHSGPLDVDFLRVVLVCCLQALRFLHTNGVIHGDVKPSNMLVDAHGRVKLGDFGLARRASSEQGSLLKGTTKYMAPELVSNQFGPIGPASDLYSLGFSAYELLCGPRFEELFPGLSTFGRDRQIAWLMWHAAPDRRLPPIHRVLEGVAKDLARVIERLSAKEQSVRYKTAAEVLEDLRPGPPAASRPTPSAEAQPPTPDKRKRLRLLGASAALAVSVVLSLAMLLTPASPKRPPAEPAELSGVVLQVDPDNRKIVIEAAADGAHVERSFTPGDKFQLNYRPGYLRQLQPGDQVRIESAVDETGRRVSLVYATRPERAEGRLQEIRLETQSLILLAGAQHDTPLELAVTKTTKITLNGQDTVQGRPVRLEDLRTDDRAAVQYQVSPKARTALEIAAQREVQIEAVLHEVDTVSGHLVVDVGKGQQARRLRLPLAPDCQVSINGARVVNQKPVGPGDLRPGSPVRIVHDSQVLRVDAYQTFEVQGTVAAVAGSTLDLRLPSGVSMAFRLTPETQCLLEGEPVSPDELRAGDVAVVTHDAPQAQAPPARQIAATRPAKANRWALVVAVGDYSDPALGRLPAAADDARALHTALVRRYAVPKAQALLVVDPPRDALKAEISKLTGALRAEHEVIVYLLGRAVRDRDGQVYLAPKDFRHEDPAGSGLAVQQVLDQLEACPARTKLLVLDTCHEPPPKDAESEPSAAEVFESLRGPPGQAALRTVTGLASCSAGQRSAGAPDSKRVRFAVALAEAYSGKADKNRDRQIEAGELLAFLSERLAAEGGPAQSPQLFLPDNRPPRLSADAKKAIRALAGLVRTGEADAAELKNLYASAQALAGREVEPRLLYGLVLLKSKQPKQRAEAQAHFEALKNEKPDLLLPLEALAWIRFERRMYQVGIDDLAELFTKLPKPKRPREAFPPERVYLFRWAGQLREFAAQVDERQAPEASLRRLDAAVAQHAPELVALYEQGREQTRQRNRQFDAQAAAARDPATKAKIMIDRRMVSSFTAFPFEEAVQAVLAGMDR